MILLHRQTIYISAVNSSNIVNVVSEEEVIRLVESHSEYEATGEMKVQYNWSAIEREVLHRYISNKPKINLLTEHLPSYVYQEDFNLHHQLYVLSDTQVSQLIISFFLLIFSLLWVIYRYGMMT